MTIEEAMFILQHGSSEGEQKYLLAVKAIGHYIKQLCEENQKLRSDYERLHEKSKLIDINAAKVQREYECEISELKMLLRLAVEDIKTALPYMTENCEIICAEGEQSCDCITTAQCECTCNWKHADEAMKLIGGDK